MRSILYILLINFSYSNPWFQIERSWVQLEGTHQQKVSKLLAWIADSEVGRSLVEHAIKKLGSRSALVDAIEVGEISYTDSTLVRTFKRRDPTYFRLKENLKISLAGNLPIVDAIMDLSHELTHLAYREFYNPYSQKVSESEFIKGAIEGVGGEVHALLTECKTAEDLFSELGRNRVHCQKIYNKKTGKYSRGLALKAFYAVGDNYDLLKDLEIKRLSKNQPLFVSSVFELPYPLALRKEYQLLMNSYCENEKQRAGLIQKTLSRRPASIKIKKSFQSLNKKLDSRCQES